LNGGWGFAYGEKAGWKFGEACCFRAAVSGFSFGQSIVFAVSSLSRTSIKNLNPEGGDVSVRTRHTPRLKLAATIIITLTAIGSWTGALAASWSVTHVTQVKGTPDMFLPGAGVANLDAGDLVSGNTRWDNDGDGIVFNDTHVGFLWSPATGAQVFKISDTLYWTSNFHFPTAISDGGVVVGTDLFRETLKGYPFLWDAADGFNFLPLPCPGPPIDNAGGASNSDCNGAANSISADGSVAVGFFRKGVFGDYPTMALRWEVTNSARHVRLDDHRLGTPDPWSNAWAVSADGSVIVGDTGASGTTLQATRWVNGVQQALEAVSTSSTARFTSSDGAFALGLATIGSQNVLVRWNGNGTATVVQPPVGATIEKINAVNPSGTAAVGALSVAGNFAPFLWTVSGGFIIIPENGREQDYDLSEALDVSDDGTVVVGALQSEVTSNGDPPPVGFLWTQSDGLTLVDDLLTVFGFTGAGIYQVSAISGDGRRILATGTFPRTNQDTTSLVIELSAP
jgi:uncharacterized membrane protein